MLIFSISMIIQSLSFLISIAFLTLSERLLLALSQNRKGPNKVPMFGTLQPILDGLKLILKMKQNNPLINMILFQLSPILNFTFCTLTFLTLPKNYTELTFLSSVLLVFVFLNMMSFFILMSSWSSNSKYSTLGAERLISMSISYEITLSSMMLLILTMKNTLNLKSLNFSNITSKALSELLILMPLLILIISESNRAPFDVIEGESELVSGFNIEYSSMEFAFIFLSEYGSTIFMSFMASLTFSWNLKLLMFLMILLTILISRSSFPRIRYDKIMDFLWKGILPPLLIWWFTNFNLKLM